MTIIPELLAGLDGFRLTIDHGHGKRLIEVDAPRRQRTNWDVSVWDGPCTDEDSDVNFIGFAIPNDEGGWQVYDFWGQRLDDRSELLAAVLALYTAHLHRRHSRR